jgi:hypothetical protein
MTTSTLKLCLFGILAAALTAMSSPVQAQQTNQHPMKKEAQTTRSNRSGRTPFHGKLKAVDKTAKTITYGETTLQVTSDTKIIKDEKPAKLEDGVIGEPVSGTYKKSESGPSTAMMIRFGAKAKTTHEAKPKKEKMD